jgi:hypothetical protein
MPEDETPDCNVRGPLCMELIPLIPVGEPIPVAFIPVLSIPVVEEPFSAELLTNRLRANPASRAPPNSNAG